MTRKTYIKPESQLIPLQTENLMDIKASTGTTDTFGKQTEFEEDVERSWEDGVESSFEYPANIPDEEGHVL